MVYEKLIKTKAMKKKGHISDMIKCLIRDRLQRAKHGQRRKWSNKMVVNVVELTPEVISMTQVDFK